MEEKATFDFKVLTLYQPIPTLFAEHGKAKGGNVLGLDRFNENLISKRTLAEIPSAVADQWPLQCTNPTLHGKTRAKTSCSKAMLRSCATIFSPMRKALAP